MKNSIDTSKEEGIEAGIVIGREMRLEEGMERGIELGTEKGVDKMRLEIAKTMKQQHYSIKEIEALTGLSEKNNRRF